MRDCPLELRGLSHRALYYWSAQFILRKTFKDSRFFLILHRFIGVLTFTSLFEEVVLLGTGEKHAEYSNNVSLSQLSNSLSLGLCLTTKLIQPRCPCLQWMPGTMVNALITFYFLI